MKRLAYALTALVFAAQVQAQPVAWEAGKHYSEIPQAQRTSVPAGKIEVLEVFSYGCPACDRFQPTMKRLKASLPANAQIVYLPASWNKAENWPLFQRAYITAQSLGIADKSHDEIYKAIWQTGELAVLDNNTGRPKRTLPSMEDVAKVYARAAGVKAADFIAASKTFGVDVKARQADAQVLAMQVPGTPTIVVNGKYRINNENLTSNEDMIKLVNFLVAKETKPAAAAAAAKKP